MVVMTERSLAGATAGAAEIAWQNPARSAIGEPQGWLQRLVGELAPSADTLGVRLVTRRESAELNGRYRGRDQPTVQVIKSYTN